MHAGKRGGRQAGKAGREGRQGRQADKDAGREGCRQAGRQAGQDLQNLPPITINKSQKHGEAPVFVFLGS